MLARQRVNDAPRKSKVDKEDVDGVLTKANHDVIRLQIPVDVVDVVHELEAIQDLIKQHQRRLQTELSSAELEEIFETWPEKVCDEKYSIRFRSHA